MIIYISEDIIKNGKIKNMKNIFSYFQKAKSLLIYSEVPFKEFKYIDIKKLYFAIIQQNNYLYYDR